jgi:bacillithiol biosynthesis cysteine-adding enzyme BshC
MASTRIPFHKIKQFSKRDIAYTCGDHNLIDRLPYPPTLDGIIQSAAERGEKYVNRELIYDQLKRQLKHMPLSERQESNLEKLKEKNCFTITTAHQPVILTGPLYVIYKALSAIKLATQLNEYQSDFTFVPIFIVGGEDHDFEEIRRTHIFNQPVQLDTDHQGGPVGKIPSETILTVVRELKVKFERDPKGLELLNEMEQAFESNEFLVQSTQSILSRIFGNLGLLVLNMSVQPLKKAFVPIIKHEILNRPSRRLVELDQKELEEAGYEKQAFAREVNFFDIKDDQRSQIQWNAEKELFIKDNDKLRCSHQEMEHLITKEPERFSPNVIMRPIFQSFILPDAAYVGGGGELAYWMERVRQFHEFQVHFPVLIRRMSIALLGPGESEQFKDLGFELEEITKDIEELKKAFVRMKEEPSLSAEREKILLLFKQIAEQVSGIDPSLKGKVIGISKSTDNNLMGLEKRMISSLKKKYNQAISKVEKLKNKIHPDHGLQERKENILSYYSRSKTDFIDTLLRETEVLQPYMYFVEL